MTKSKQKKSQLDIIRAQLRKGSVNNVAAFKGIYGRPILRLGALIYTLRWEEGMDIETFYKNKKGFRNAYYKLKK